MYDLGKRRLFQIHFCFLSVYGGRLKSSFYLNLFFLIPFGSPFALFFLAVVSKTLSQLPL